MDIKQSFGQSSLKNTRFPAETMAALSTLFNTADNFIDAEMCSPRVPGRGRLSISYQTQAVLLLEVLESDTLHQCKKSCFQTFKNFSRFFRERNADQRIRYFIFENIFFSDVVDFFISGSL
ncbi:hypothetical protein PoB_002490400 [Plakobranchus ocellatus]|uniref:Uncharacterized protein n=1 Tax=Plakobranchus ocellatus TaxID=259542 RepID=A0AAV3ZSS8_9GAST|nr:hypothetical protein PoB_002490400 [Plakobranchus ocellatus]